MDRFRRYLVLCLLAGFGGFAGDVCASTTVSRAQATPKGLSQDSATASRALPATGTSANLKLFDEVVAAAPVFAAAGWTEEVAALKLQLGTKPPRERVLLGLNALFARRAAAGESLVHIYDRSEQSYWALASCFGADLQAAGLSHAGAWFERHGKRWFVRDVLAGGPAERAGLLRGDEIVSAGGTPLSPVRSFATGTSVAVLFRRLPWEEPRRTEVQPERSSLARALLTSVTASYSVRNVQGMRIAYVKLPLTCHKDFEASLLTLAKTAQVAADAMVLDLRGSFIPGGLTPLSPFFAVPGAGDTASTPRGLAPYAKPLVVLVDAGTAGGREELAMFLQKHHRATLVGTPTAGAAAPGRASELEPDASLLWIARSPSYPPLIPDHLVEASLVYAAGADPQLDAALSEAAKMAY